MYRLFPYILLLFVAAEAGAQQLPERGLVRRGNRSYARGDYARAIERYERALKAAPGSFEATYDLGNALCRAERFDQSEQTLARAAADTLRTDDERAEAFYNLGNAQFSQQKYKEALESYKQSLRLAPADMEAKYNYAYTKKLLEDQQQNGGGNDDQQDQNQDQNQISRIGRARSPGSRSRARASRSRARGRAAPRGSRSRSSSRCSTPYRRRRTARRRSSRRSRASSCAARKIGNITCTSIHPIYSGCWHCWRR